MMSTAPAVVAGVLTIPLIGGYIYSQSVPVSCSECKGRGPTWQWTDNYYQGGTTGLNGWVCRTFGICQCRSAEQERNCAIFGAQVNGTNNQKFEYDFQQSQQSTNYECACINQNNKGDARNCAAQSTEGLCTQCSEPTPQ